MLSTDVFDQVTDNPGTSVQPSWLAEDVRSSLSLSTDRAAAWRVYTVPSLPSSSLGQMQTVPKTIFAF